MAKVCAHCFRSFYDRPSDDSHLVWKCNLDAPQDIVTGEYPTAETCEENRKPGRLCGPLGRKYGSIGW